MNKTSQITKDLGRLIIGFLFVGAIIFFAMKMG